MVSGAVARPSASSPGGSVRRTTGGESSPADALSPPMAKPAKARPAASTAVLAKELMRPLFPRPVFLALLIPLHRALRMVGLAHRLRGRHTRYAEGARARSAGDLRAALVAGRVQRGLGLRVCMVLL